MVKLYVENFSGYIEVEVREFYCNDYPNYFARTGKDTFIRSSELIYGVPEIKLGSTPIDDGNLILSPEEKDELIAKNPAAEKWIHPFMGSKEFINKIPRFCLWLEDCPPNELRKMKLVYERVEKVREFRLQSKRGATIKASETPWLFAERRRPTTDYLLVPLLSSSRREYIPIGYMNANTIVSNLAFEIPNAKFWHFGVLTSFPHMVWTRMICGRFKSDYRYSSTIVYNNFPWPPFNREVERTALKILLARKNYPDASYADLYDPLIMPKDLRKAHEENDRAVMEAYDFPKNMTEKQMRLAFIDIYNKLKNFDALYNSL